MGERRRFSHQQERVLTRRLPSAMTEQFAGLPKARSNRATQVLDSSGRLLSRIDDVLGNTQTASAPVSVYESPKARYEQIKSGLSWRSTTRDYVNFFNTFHTEEELPQNWQSLQYGESQVGFSMKGQMDLLKGDDLESRSVWAKQTRQDLQGFVIEYLSPYIVYPWHHEKKENPDGSANLVDTRYGGKKMIDTVSKDERGGSVKSIIEAIDSAVVQKKVPDKSIFVQWSPMDESATGLKQDNGSDVVYADTHLIISQVNGDRLDGVTVKTDLTPIECREMIKRLTGRKIPIGAPVEDYINAVALIDPTKNRIGSIEDVVAEAASVRSDLSLGSSSAYKDRSWDSVREQIGQGDKLYEFTARMQAILKQFEEDVLLDNPTREELKEYIAATVLRVSQEAQAEKAQEGQRVNSAGDGARNVGTKTYITPNFGSILDITSRIPGCAGGGKTAVSGAFGVSRAIDISSGGTSACPEIKCGGCSWKASESEAKGVQSGSISSCPSCGWSPK